jgi:hypothetical protein
VAKALVSRGATYGRQGDFDAAIVDHTLPVRADAGG